MRRMTGRRRTPLNPTVPTVPSQKQFVPSASGDRSIQWRQRLTSVFAICPHCPHKNISLPRCATHWPGFCERLRVSALMRPWGRRRTNSKVLPACFRQGWIRRRRFPRFKGNYKGVVDCVIRLARCCLLASIGEIYAWRCEPHFKGRPKYQKRGVALIDWGHIWGHICK